MDLTRIGWRKSSYSSASGDNCVEVGTATGAVAVRDSKGPAGAALTVSPQTWLAFTRRLQQS